jgi:CelD/BcsL family acetyltransferase involved in cellulose biosynthesis
MMHCESPAHSHSEPVVIETVDIRDDEWFAFLQSQDRATPFHHPAWAKVISEVYGFPAAALIIRAPDGTIGAGLPAIRVPSLGRRARWKCLPFTDVCGPLGRDQEMCALMTALRACAHEDWEVRSAVPGLGTVRTVAVSHCLDLRVGLETIYAGFHRSQVQRALRRAERDRTVRVREATELRDLTEIYYRLHVDTRKRQGVPPQPRRLFAAIWDELHTVGLASTHLAEIEGRAIAGAVFLHWNRMLVYKYGASRSETWKAHPNHVILWHVIRKASETGITRLDFGLTDTSNRGLRAFKSSWGAQEEELRYTFSRSATQSRATNHSHAQTLLGAAIRRSPPRVCEWIGDALYRFAA